MPKLQLRVTRTGEKEASSYFITIPKELVNSVGFKDGDILLWSKHEKDKLLLEKS